MKTTIDMAKEAGAGISSSGRWLMTQAELEILVALVRADERNRTWTQEHWTEYERSIAAAEREACVKECKKLIKVFLSPQYKTGQPLSSFILRHAVAACIEAIEARGTT